MNQPSGEFGPIYEAFKDRPKEAILHLLRVQNGECTSALYREDIGYIDIVWGENDANNKGYGLKHIVEKHGEEIKQLGFSVEDFISMVVQHGEASATAQFDRYVFDGNGFRFVVEVRYKGKEKKWLLTTFRIRKKPE